MGLEKHTKLKKKKKKKKKNMLKRKINLAKLFVLHKLSFTISSLSNLINTFDDLFRHTYVTNFPYEIHKGGGVVSCLLMAA